MHLYCMSWPASPFIFFILFSLLLLCQCACARASLCVCVCVCVYVCVCARTCVCIDVCTHVWMCGGACMCTGVHILPPCGGLRLIDAGLLLDYCLPYIVRQGLLLTLKLTVFVRWVNQLSQRILVSISQALGLQVGLHTHPALAWILGSPSPQACSAKTLTTEPSLQPWSPYLKQRILDYISPKIHGQH